MARTIVYGFVTRLPKDANEIWWETEGHRGDNPEGKFRYRFSDQDGWRQHCFTRLDMEYFTSLPIEYRFESVSGRPESVRPTRPSPIEYFDKKVAESQPKTPVVDHMPPVPVEAPVPEAPKKRMGRPPKMETQTGAN